MKRKTWVTLSLALLASNQLTASESVKFESSIGAGAIISGNENVSPSPVITGDFGWKIGTSPIKLLLGAQLGQALHFNEKDQYFSVVNGEQNNGHRTYNPYATQSHHNTDDDTIIIENNTTNVTVNVENTPVPAPVLRNLSEQSYFFGEPRLGAEFSLEEILSFYGFGFMGVARMTRQDGTRDKGTSYGAGGGVKARMDASHLFFGEPVELFVNAEYLHRKIEIGRHGYDHEQFTGGVGIGF